MATTTTTMTFPSIEEVASNKREENRKIQARGEVEVRELEINAGTSRDQTDISSEITWTSSGKNNRVVIKLSTDFRRLTVIGENSYVGTENWKSDFEINTSYISIDLFRRTGAKLDNGRYIVYQSGPAGINYAKPLRLDTIKGGVCMREVISGLTVYLFKYAEVWCIIYPGKKKGSPLTLLPYSSGTIYGTLEITRHINRLHNFMTSGGPTFVKAIIHCHATTYANISIEKQPIKDGAYIIESNTGITNASLVLHPGVHMSPQLPFNVDKLTGHDYDSIDNILSSTLLGGIVISIKGHADILLFSERSYAARKLFKMPTFSHYANSQLATTAEFVAYEKVISSYWRQSGKPGGQVYWHQSFMLTDSIDDIVRRTRNLLNIDFPNSRISTESEEVSAVYVPNAIPFRTLSVETMKEIAEKPGKFYSIVNDTQFLEETKCMHFVSQMMCRILTILSLGNAIAGSYVAYIYYTRTLQYFNAYKRMKKAAYWYYDNKAVNFSKDATETEEEKDNIFLSLLFRNRIYSTSDGKKDYAVSLSRAKFIHGMTEMKGDFIVESNRFVHYCEELGMNNPVPTIPVREEEKEEKQPKKRVKIQNDGFTEVVYKQKKNQIRSKSVPVILREENAFSRLKK